MSRRSPVGLVSIDSLAEILNAYEIALMLIAESSGCLVEFRANVHREIEERTPRGSEAANLFVLKRLAKRMRAKSSRFERHHADSVDARIDDIARALELTRE